MVRTFMTATLLMCAAAFAAAQADVDPVLTAFSAKVDKYAEMHRRIEGPVPPLEAGKDFAEVRRLMNDLRKAIRREGLSKPEAYLSRDVRLALRKRVAAVMKPEEIQSIMEDLKEHAPPFMAKIQVYQPLPADAPFVQIPPRMLKALPQLPPGLRYVILEQGLVLWDEHADLVVDVAPGMLNPSLFRTVKGGN